MTEPDPFTPCGQVAPPGPNPWTEAARRQSGPRAGLFPQSLPICTRATHHDGKHRKYDRRTFEVLAEW